MSETPAPPTVAGRLNEKSNDSIVVKIPGSDYRLELAPKGEITQAVGEKVTGVVQMQAQRIDLIEAGGRFVEPVFGRPRVIQGRIVGGDVSGNLLYVQAGVKIAVSPMAPQQAGDFAIGQMITCSVEPGATFQSA